MMITYVILTKDVVVSALITTVLTLVNALNSLGVSLVRMDMHVPTTTNA